MFASSSEDAEAIFGSTTRVERLRDQLEDRAACIVWYTQNEAVERRKAPRGQEGVTTHHTNAIGGTTPPASGGFR